ncbi:MAG TPA: flagellar biosynthesis protein FlhA [Planctomycetota bacterium]|nr:flagellar biosynthesis protein FlhA [Planctomycetota bacterium]
MTFDRMTDGVTKHRDLLFVAGLLGILFIVFVPMPTPLVDLLLVGSMGLSIMVLLASVYAKEPAGFSVLPSALLLLTAYRLALNIATTRLILGTAHERGTSAAGEVIRAFGEFVGGHDLIVGFVLFAILLIVNFIVITKGAGRISEVAARFMLDAMPGKQMAVDTDLNSGAIDEKEARARRAKIAKEADFYGAMDGATKFVRGDAIAAVLITLVNIIGGFLIGTLRHGMPLSEALQTYTILTIGEGLVAQIPALIVSLGAGLIVTRATTSSDLGRDFLGQIFSERKAVAIAAIFLLVLAPTGLPFLPLAAGAGLLGAIVWTLGRGAKAAEKREADQRSLDAAAPPAPVSAERLLRVEPLEIEVGLGLVRLLDAGYGLVARIEALRRELAADLGLLVPAARVRDTLDLESTHYRIRLRGVTIAKGALQAERLLAVDTGRVSGPLEGLATRDPIQGRPAFWISEAGRSEAEGSGYRVSDAVSVLHDHLRDVLRRNAADLLTRDDVTALVKSLKEARPAVVEEVVPAVVRPGELQKVLRNLLREGVSIRDLGTILETLGDYGPRTKDPEILTEYVRQGLAGTLCARHLDPDGRLYVITLDPKLEDMIRGATERNESGSVLAIAPSLLAGITQRVGREVDRLVAAGHAAVILCAPAVRAQVRRLADMIQPGIEVLSFNEILRDVRVEALGMVTAE